MKLFFQKMYTKSSGKDVQVFDRRFRSGAPPRVPTYDGNRDPAVINRWKKKVRIWKRLASPYLPLPEMGLRLHDDGLTGRAAEIIHEEDDEEKYFCSEGCDLVVKRVLYHFQEDDMVELGDRLDTFFDKLRRHAGETLLDNHPLRHDNINGNAEYDQPSTRDVYAALVYLFFVLLVVFWAF